MDSLQEIIAVFTSYPYNILVGAVVVGTAYALIRACVAGEVCRSKVLLKGKTCQSLGYHGIS